jgi:hypothetical protein
VKQHHFVIKFDEETKAWSWDTDAEEAFQDGTIYDTETKKWSSAYKGAGEYDETDNELAEILQTNLRAMNGDQ